MKKFGSFKWRLKLFYVVDEKVFWMLDRLKKCIDEMEGNVLL